MSNKKSKTWTSTVAAGANDTITLPALPLDELWVITTFGAVDINVGDSKSSLYLLKWDNDIVDGGIISVTGSTYEIKSTWEFVGDGIKQLSIQRFNTSNTNKQMPVWVQAYKRS